MWRIASLLSAMLPSISLVLSFMILQLDNDQSRFERIVGKTVLKEVKWLCKTSNQETLLEFWDIRNRDEDRPHERGCASIGGNEGSTTCLKELTSFAKVLDKIDNYLGNLARNAMGTEMVDSVGELRDLWV